MVLQVFRVAEWYHLTPQGGWAKASAGSQSSRVLPSLLVGRPLSLLLGGPSPRLNDFIVSLELSHQLDYCEATEADKHHTWPPGRVESMDPQALISPGRRLWA